MKKLNQTIFLFVLLFISVTNVAYSQMITPWPLQGGEKIFFVKINSAINTELYAMDPDGSNVQKLSDFGLGIYVIRPKISADGKSLTFISNYECWKSRNDQDVFKLDLLTGELHRITGDVWAEPLTEERGTLRVHYKVPFNPTASPAFITYRGCSKEVSVNYNEIVTFQNVPVGTIWVKARSSNGVGNTQDVVITANGITDVTMDTNWGTTNYSNAFPSPDGAGIIATLNVENLGKNISDTDGDVSFSYLDIYNNGTLIDQITWEPFNQGLFSISNGAFSNDGTKMAFSVGNPFFESLVYVNTSNYHADPIPIEVRDIILPSQRVSYSNPSWSPDGEKIVFQKIISANTDNPISSNIYEYNFTTENLTQITNNSGRNIATNPGYSPNGKQIVFNLCTSTKNQFFLGDYMMNNYSITICKKDLITETIIPLNVEGLINGDLTWGNVSGSTPIDTTTTTILQENFDKDVFPPENWVVTSFNEKHTWKQDYREDPDFRDIDPNDEYSAFCEWDSLDSDEWLITPQFALGDGPASLEFYALYNSKWLKEATLKLQISTNGGNTWTELWHAINDGDNRKWRKTIIDLSAYSGNSNLKLAWEYMGNWGDVVAVDGIKLTGVSDSITGVLTVSKNTLSIEATENSTKAFEITSTVSWSATSNQNWLTISPVNGSGNSTIILTALANPTTETRTATVTVSGTGVTDQTITVIQDVGITGINDLDNSIISIFPNPANTSLFINGLPQNSMISVFEINGKQIIGKKLSNSQLDISELKRGIYTLIISNNNKTVKRKFIKL